MAKSLTIKNKNNLILYPKTVSSLVYDNSTGNTVKQDLDNLVGQVAELLGVENAFFGGIVGASTDIATDYTNNGYSGTYLYMVGTDMSSLVTYQYTGSGSPMQLFGGATYDFTDYSEVKQELAALGPKIDEIPYTQAGAVGDLDLVDGGGNVIARFQNGHIKTKNFDSSNINISDAAIENKIYSIFGNNCEKIVASSVSNGTILSSSNYPYHLKKGMVMSFYMDLSTFGSITIGKGNNQYRGQYFTIDSTNIVQKFYESNVTVKETQPHGLTISDFIKVVLYNGDDGNCTVILQSKGGYYQHSFNWGYEANYAAFVLSTNTTGANAVLNLGNSDFKKPIWFFGDSYFGIAAIRWPGCLKTMGYFDYLIDGLAGQNSTNAYTELERCLNFGKPKTLVWCLGMNDTDSNWSSIVENVKTLCSTNNIELILATIPTVPTRDKETISSSVRNSGYRYIDFYKAVGANSSGSWHTGYLESGVSEAVHPTELGAQALATQVLIDFPEIMQQENSYKEE